MFRMDALSSLLPIIVRIWKLNLLGSLLVVSVLLALTGHSWAQAVQSYTQAPLPPLDIPDGFAVAGGNFFNNLGQVAGNPTPWPSIDFDRCTMYGDENQVPLTPALYTPGSGWQVFPLLPPMPYCSPSVEVTSLNNLGQFVGMVLGDNEVTYLNAYPFIYRGSGFENLNSLVQMNGFDFRPVSINDSGQILGATTLNGHRSGVLVSGNVATIAPGLLSDHSYDICCMNNAGLFAAADNTTGDFVLWDGTTLHHFSSTYYGFAEDINDSGEVLLLFASYRQGIVVPGPTIYGLSFSRLNNFGEAIGIYPLNPQDPLTQLGCVLWNIRNNTYVFARANGSDEFRCIDINDSGQILGVAPNSVSSIYTPMYEAPTGIGANVAVDTGRAAITYSDVLSSGSTTVTPIDPSSAGSNPGGFALSDSLAYEVSTTATFTGPVTIGFAIPASISETDFYNLRILHNENGSLNDVTSSYDLSSHTIFAVVNSFSPFYAVLLGRHINPLFDQTKAVRAGSTIPIKFQLMDPDGHNVSSPGMPVTARQLRYISADINAEIVDSGNANPDYQFRYDPSLGGYIYNLSTKGLKSGRYGLSFWVGAEKRFFHTVSFQVK